MTTKRGFEAMRKALVTIDAELNHAREAGEIYAYSPLCQRLEAIQRQIARALNVAAGKDSVGKFYAEPVAPVFGKGVVRL